MINGTRHQGTVDLTVTNVSAVSASSTVIFLVMSFSETPSRKATSMNTARQSSLLGEETLSESSSGRRERLSGVSYSDPQLVC